MSTLGALVIVMLIIGAVLTAAAIVGAVVSAVFFGVWLDSLLLQWLTL